MNEYSNVKYSKNFVVKVLYKIDFSPILDDNVIFHPDFINYVISKYQKKEKDQLLNFGNFKIDIDPTKAPQFNSNGIMSLTQKHFKNNAGTAACIFSGNSLALEFNHYDNFENIYNDIESITNKLFRIKNNIGINRIGLRYINIFDENKMKIYKSYFSDSISSMIDFKKEKINGSELNVSRAMITNEYIFNDLRITYRFGKFNPNYPGPISNESLTLDLDSVFSGFCDSSDEIFLKVRSGHDIIQNLFEKSISDKLRRLMSNE